ncbi:MAG: hypothetical protein ACI9JL_000480 [Paracoccaceae bacterium]|jgi:hypothetical protein
MTEAEVRDAVDGAVIYTFSQDEPGQFPEPQPLPEGPPKAAPLEARMIPDELAPWITDIAERMQVPPDFVAAPAIVAAGSLIGRQVAIRPGQHNDYAAVPNLWGAIIGAPSSMKTGAMGEALGPLTALERAMNEGYEHDLEEWESLHRIEIKENKRAEQSIEEALKKGDSVAAEAESRSIQETPPPAERRLKTHDATVEKLGEILAVNPNGVLQCRDELTGFLKSFDKAGREGDRAFYLEAWNGDKGFIVDRVGRGTTRIEACCVSIMGTIQPGPLADHIRDARQGGAKADGLMQRFQVMVWPDCSAAFTLVDRRPDDTARQRAKDVFARLLDLDLGAVGAFQEGEEMPYLRFTRDAQGLFNEWREELERRLREPDTLSVSMETHLGKYRSLVPSLALIFHLIDGQAGCVGGASLSRAIKWARYLESHARKVYASGGRTDEAATSRLGRKIQTGAFDSDNITVRDIVRKGWSGLNDNRDVVAAVNGLVDADWLIPQERNSTGRPTTTFTINPNISGGRG